MQRFLRLLTFGLAAAGLGAVGLADECQAGAFTLPEGQGQIIAGVGYIAATRTFDRSGKPVVAPSYRKDVLSAFAEYGATDWLTAIVAPSLAHMESGSPTKSFTGSDESAFGARLRLFGTPTRVVSVQALVEPPLGARRDAATEAAFGGPHAAAVDLRLQYGEVFLLFGWPSFATIEPGVRLRGDGWPDEARLDLAVGFRPKTNILVLLQNFNSAAHGVGTLISQMSSSKLQGSIVFDLSSRVALQVGGLRTIAGRNAAREVGPFGALWYWF